MILAKKETDLLVFINSAFMKFQYMYLTMNSSEVIILAECENSLSKGGEITLSIINIMEPNPNQDNQHIKY